MMRHLVGMLFQIGTGEGSVFNIIDDSLHQTRCIEFSGRPGYDRDAAEGVLMSVFDDDVKRLHRPCDDRPFEDAHGRRRLKGLDDLGCHTLSLPVLADHCCRC